MPGLGGLLFNSSTEEPSVYYVPIQAVMEMGVFCRRAAFQSLLKGTAKTFKDGDVSGAVVFVAVGMI